MIILGVATPFIHNPSAAILVDGRLIVACDEERFIRKTHTRGYSPLHAVDFVLRKKKS